MKTLLLLLSYISYSLLFLIHHSHKLPLPPLFQQLYSPENPRMVTVTSFTPKFNTMPKDFPIPLPNTQYSYSPIQFSLDDTSSLPSLHLACSPSSYGYSKERGEQLFPYHGYPNCSVTTGITDTYLHIDRELNLLSMNCPWNSFGQYVAGPIDNRTLVLHDDVVTKWEIMGYWKPVDAEQIDFGLGGCSGEKYFQQAFLAPKKNVKAFEEAKKKMKEGERPKIIYFLTLDSVSRRHFFRKLPKVAEFFNNLNETHPDFAVYDFKLHNVIGGNSVANQVPIFGGIEQFLTKFPGNQDVDRLGKHAIWNIIREKGYISLFGMEDCDHYFSVSLGKSIKVDYSVRQFYCAVKQFSPIGFELHNIYMQRCLAGYQTHYYMLNYTHNLVAMNQGVNQWLYVHLNAAHEGSGLHAETLNYDIKEFLTRFLDDYGKNNDIIIILQADHGMNYGISLGEIDGYQEKKLPCLFIIASKSLLDKYPVSYNSLAVNSQRFTSKLDLRETMLYLAGITEKTKYSINLLNEIAPNYRTCLHTHIDDWECSCNPMVELDSPSDSQKQLLETLKKYAERVINSYSYTFPGNYLRQTCRKIKLERIVDIYHIPINNVNEFFRLKINTAWAEEEFEIDFFLASDGAKMEADRTKFPVENILFRAFPIKARVTFS